MAHPLGRDGGPRWPLVAASVAWGTVAALLAAMLLIDRRLTDAGRPDLRAMDSDALGFLVTALVATTVGAVLAARHPGNPVGWLFLALSGSIALSGVGQGYGAYGVLARPGSWPGAGEVASVAAGLWIVWFVLVAEILLLTPTGRPLSRRWAGVVVAAPVFGAVSWIGHTFRSGTLDDAPFEGLENALAAPGAAGDVFAAAAWLAGAAALCLVLGAISVVVRFRRARGDERRQLLWLAVVVIPLPLVVVGLFAAAMTNSDTALNVLTAVFLLTVPVGAGLSVARYRLYDVDRILSRAASYVLLTLLLAGVYVATVLFVVWSLREVSGRSHIATAVATLATAAAAVPALRRVQDGLDRRFSRRRFEARAVLREGLRGSERSDPEALLRRALGDDSLRIAYRVDDAWSLATGAAVVPTDDEVRVVRDERPIASIASIADRELVESLAVEAGAELENVALRAAVARQLAEVRESRARLVQAQLAERHRIERNLHDGAQQRLLALAFQLRAAQLREPDGPLATELDAAVSELQVAVRELRELANGLHPSVLTDGGLAAALAELATRSPVPVRLAVTPDRFPPAAEAAAWFVACEAVANAVKHARAGAVEIRAQADGAVLRLAVCDDGVGGADPAGPGLRGLADRAEAAGGRLEVRHGSDGKGTEIVLELPCAS